MKKNYDAPAVEVYNAEMTQMLAQSKEEISVGGETGDIEEVKDFIWEE